MVWGFHGFPTKDSSNYYPPEKKSTSKIKNSDNDLASNVTSDTPANTTSKFALDEVKSTEFINYDFVEDTNLPADVKSEIKAKAANLKSSGSFSKGKITHEFTNTKYYRDKLKQLGGYEKIKDNLSFEPTDTSKVFNNYDLIGGDYSGTYVENKGFNSVFRSYTNSNSSIEINEIALDRNSDKLNFFKDNVNNYINDAPATVEKIDNGNIYNISWVSNNRLFSMSTQGLSEAESMKKAQEIASIVNY